MTASATLQSTLASLIAGVAGVSSSAVSLLGVADLPAGSRRRLLLLPGDVEGGARQLAAAAASAVTVTVLLPASRGSNATEVQRIVAALSAYVQSGQLGAALAASAALQVRMRGRARMGGEGELGCAAGEDKCERSWKEAGQGGSGLDSGLDSGLNSGLHPSSSSFSPIAER